MAFCSNCGQKLPEGAKFCNGCGAKVVTANTEETVNTPAEPVEKVVGVVQDDITERKDVYEGVVHKCPNCGDIIDAYETVCEACGFEIRGRKATSSVRELASKIEAIEAGRTSRSIGFIVKRITQTDEKKISLIRNFSIPNTKEDLYEFLVLSKSNIDVDVYQNDSPMMKADARVAVSDAWRAKFEQAYQKAKLVFAGDPRMADIEQMYESQNKSIKKAKTKVWKTLGIVYGILFGIAAIGIILGVTLSSSAEKKEAARLDAIVEQLEVALDNEDYKLALMHADSLRYRESDPDIERDWEIKREYWIDKVIEEAAADGVTLERPKDPAPDTTESSTTNSTDTGDSNDAEIDSAELVAFTEGYEKAEFDKYNSNASENGLGGTRIYFEGKITKTEILNADGTTTILGYVEDIDKNNWLVMLHFVPAVSETQFDSVVGKPVVVRGVYDGFSGTKKLPVVVMDELMIKETSETMMGMQKLLDE